MKRHFCFAGSVGPAQDVSAHVPLACGTDASSVFMRFEESSSCKRVKLTQVNGCIVYTRDRKSRISFGHEKFLENSGSNRLKCFNKKINDDHRSSSCGSQMTGTVVEGNHVLSTRVCEESIENGIRDSIGITKVVERNSVEKNVVGDPSVAVNEGSVRLSSLVEAVIEESRIVEEREIVGNVVVEKIVMKEIPVAEQSRLTSLRMSRSGEDVTRQAEWPVSIEGDLDGLSASMDDDSEGKHDLHVKARVRYKKSLVDLKVESPGSLDGQLQASGTDMVPTFNDEEAAEGTEVDTPKILELVMSKNTLNKCLMTVKELLETGFLDEVPVVYMGTIRSKSAGLRGIIRDGGILCFCSYCKGCRVIPPSQFEIHACKQYKRASQYICFENGKSLLEVLRACRKRPLHKLEVTIRSFLTASPEEKSSICRRCKGTVGLIGPLCNSCVKSQGHPSSPTSSHPRLHEQLLKGTLEETFSRNESPENIARKSPELDMEPKTPKYASLCTPQHTSSSNVSRKSVNPIRILKSCKSDPSHLYSGNSSHSKMTRKDQQFHKLVFESGGLLDGTEVAYYARGQKLLEGYKIGFGIFCRCCNSEVSPSQFEAHAGWASRRKPYAYIYTSNGVSLHELALSLSKVQQFSVKDSDNVCIICGNSGNLLLCDGCTRAFHKGCVCLPTVPHGRWYCNYCQHLFVGEKFLEHNANAVAAGRVFGVDSIDQITRRCIRIVKDIEPGTSGCVLCRCSDFSRSGFGPRTILLCDQCEKEYHVGCLKTHKIADLRELPRGKWFCCCICSRIYSSLQKLLVSGPERLSNYLLDVMKKKNEENSLDGTICIDVRWRILSGKLASNGTRLLLSQAVTIFHECFDPIVDSATGRDLIPCMVYGRTIRGQDFGGMYCVVLTVNSSVVSAGILRVFGHEFAELPLVATSLTDRRKGYFQLLFSCIEKLLAFLNVESIVLPAAEQAQSIWTDKFGFQELQQEQLSRYRRGCYPMVMFEGTSMLQKRVPACIVTDAN